MHKRFVRKIGSHDIWHANFVIVFWMIYFFIDIINVIIWIFFIISQKCVIFTLFFTKFSGLSSKFFCFLLLMVWIFIQAITFFATNIIPFFLWLTAIILVIVVIMSIITLVILIIAIIAPKLTICKILNIGSVAVIMCYDKRSKLIREFFKDYCKSKQYKL